MAPRSARDRGKLRACVWLEVEVDEEEWMQHYGENIKRRGLVPSVTLANAVKKQSKKAMQELGLKTLEFK